MSLTRLPLGLVDLTLTRAFSRLNVRASLSCTTASPRALHQVALVDNGQPDETDETTQSFIPEKQNRRTFRGQKVALRSFLPPPTELEKRVRALQGVVVSEESILNLPAFSEEELLAVYEDLLAIPTTQNAKTVLPVIESSQASLTRELEIYAQNGDVQKAEQLLNKRLNGTPTERQRDLHIKAYIKATPPNTIPTPALSLLHTYEAKGLPCPMSSYTRVITALFSARSSIAHAQAWDLFSHMRYVAHPHPDGRLYTHMIRACASSPFMTGRAEPERALDLWTEMTIDRGILPTTSAYGAIILACARSGEKTYVNEAFRLAKEMLDSHRDARGRSAFRPDTMMFRGLLEGAKRVGDLGKARWILAEMVKVNNADASESAAGEDLKGGVRVNDEVLVHMFHAYAAYKAPFKRSTTILLNQKIHLVESDSGPSAATKATIAQDDLTLEEPPPSFAHIPPQSQSEVVGEAKALFLLMTEAANDTSRGKMETVSGASLNLKDIRLTTRLLNAYLSVYYAHSSLAVAQEMFNTLFTQFRVEKDAWSYVEALERCGLAHKETERLLAPSFAQELWDKWSILEDRWKPGVYGDNELDARMIERAYAAMIRVLTITGHTERALDLVKSFFRRYPPEDVRKPSAKPAFRSTRTVLAGMRPLVRMSTPLEVPDDTVPPLLTFTDVEILHHRLVMASQRDAIGFLKYMCKAYEGALRTRRDGTMKAKPSKLDYPNIGKLESRADKRMRIAQPSV